MTKSSAVLNIIANVIVDSHQSCLAAASNRLLIQFNKIKNVVIDGLTSENTAQSTANCTSAQDIQIGPLHDTLRQTLMQKMTTALGSIKGDTVRLIDNIVESIDVSVVSSCLAVATNQIAVSIQDISGQVELKDVNFTQTATSSVAKCLSVNTVRVGSVPDQPTLLAYLDANQANYTLDGAAPPPAADPRAYDEYGKLVLIGAASGLIMYIIVLVVVILTMKRYIFIR